jgi:hypothetical protein
LIGRSPSVGYDHHLWYVELAGSHLRFIPKGENLSRQGIITRGDLGRKMTEAESGVALFWQDNFTSGYLSRPNDLELKDFRDTVFDSLKNATRHRA